MVRNFLRKQVSTFSLGSVQHDGKWLDHILLCYTVTDTRVLSRLIFAGFRLLKIKDEDSYFP